MTPFNLPIADVTPVTGLLSLLFIYGVIWLFVLAGILQRSDFDPVTKLTWVIVVMFIPFFGMVLYGCIALHPSSVNPLNRKKIDPNNQLSGTPWEDDSGYTKGKQL